MMIKNTINEYGLVAKCLHWLIALLLICMFLVAYTMINIPRSEFQFTLFYLHKATGLLILGLITLRLVWRLINVQPPLPPTVPQWQHVLSRSIFILLYILVFAMPLSGFLMSTLGGHTVSFYSLFVIPAFDENKALSSFFAETHNILSYILIAAFVLHVLGALYHHYFLKDKVLSRMWFTPNKTI